MSRRTSQNRFLRFKGKRKQGTRKQIRIERIKGMNKEQINLLFHNITNHLLSDEKPSDYINDISKKRALEQYPFSLLELLRLTEQSPKYHPEGNVWNHTMMVVDEAAKLRGRSKNPEVFMWSALLHDIGKPNTTRNRKGKITSYDHDKEGERLCLEFLHNFSLSEAFVQSVAAMVRYHMHMLYILKNLPYADPEGLLKRVEIEDIALLYLCDRLGRAGADVKAETKEYMQFLNTLMKNVMLTKNK
jgi:putative nucleotidyltransferase with HDIG domain